MLGLIILVFSIVGCTILVWQTIELYWAEGKRLIAALLFATLLITVAWSGVTTYDELIVESDNQTVAALLDAQGNREIRIQENEARFVNSSGEYCKATIEKLDRDRFIYTFGPTCHKIESR